MQSITIIIGGIKLEVDTDPSDTEEDLYRKIKAAAKKFNLQAKMANAGIEFDPLDGSKVTFSAKMEGSDA